MKKRGMFFTIIAIYLISIFLLSYAIYFSVSDRSAINERVSSANSFVFALERDMSKQVYISGYRAIVSLENYITENGIFILDSENALKEALLNGTVNSESVELMEGYKINDWNSTISAFGNKVGLFVNYSIQEINVNQDNPWSIKIETLIHLIVKDKGNLVQWEKTEFIVSEIEINGFEDPLYLISTNGKISNRINSSNFSSFVSGTDVSNLTLQCSNSYYIASALAPSFLDRLEGKTSSNPQGIESLVYVPELSAQGISAKDKSVVDYIYFSDLNPESSHITGMPSWFKLDNAHLSIYNATGLAY